MVLAVFDRQGVPHSLQLADGLPVALDHFLDLVVADVADGEVGLVANFQAPVDLDPRLLWLGRGGRLVQSLARRLLRLGLAALLVGPLGQHHLLVPIQLVGVVVEWLRRVHLDGLDVGEGVL